MNEKALEQLNKNIDELRTLLHDVGTVAAVFKTITLLRSVLGERERNIDLRHPTNKPSFFWGINLRVDPTVRHGDSTGHVDEILP